MYCLVVITAAIVVFLYSYSYGIMILAFSITVFIPHILYSIKNDKSYKKQYNRVLSINLAITFFLPIFGRISKHYFRGDSITIVSLLCLIGSMALVCFLMWYADKKHSKRFNN